MKSRVDGDSIRFEDYSYPGATVYPNGSVRASEIGEIEMAK